MPKRKLPLSFYQRDNVVTVTRELVGKFLCTRINGDVVTTGMITEAEAYSEVERASHAFNSRRTNRTEVMFAPGGKAYVYLCYGIHHLFNVVIGPDGKALAALIRAVQPVDGLETILERRGAEKLNYKTGAGPGSVSKALGINTSHYGLPLTGNTIWIEDRGIVVTKKDIIASPRVGVDYAGEDAKLPWRFRLKGNLYTSLPR